MADDVAFPTLSDSELSKLESLGTRRPVAAGEYLYRAGDVNNFFVIVSGAVEGTVRADGEERVIRRITARQFLGELNLLTGQRALVSAAVVEPGEVIEVPRSTLRSLIRISPLLGDKILAAFLARRAILLSKAAAAIRVIGSRFSRGSQQVREFLARHRLPHEWLDPDRDPTVETVLREVGISPGELPVVIVSGTVLRDPTPGELADYLGLTLGSLPDRRFDLVVVGGGPAGLAAAVYAASEGLGTIVVERIAPGGQAGVSSRIENYFGFPTGISGQDLTQRAVVQAERFGASLTSPCAATSLREEAGHFIVDLADGSKVVGRSVVIATGARYRRLEVERLEDFEGNGVYYAATEMEARQCTGSPVVVVGGGNGAGQAAVFLTKSGSSVTLVVRSAELEKHMSRYLVDRIKAYGRIDIRTKAEVIGLEGDGALTAVWIRSDGGDVRLPCVALFSFIGAEPSADWLGPRAAVDSGGFVLTDAALGQEHVDEYREVLGRQPLPFETSRPGLFAVGDVRSGSTKRVAAAVGEGSASVRSVHDYLSFAR